MWNRMHTKRGDVARTVLTLGLSLVLAVGGVPVPALAFIAGEELEEVQGVPVDVNTDEDRGAGGIQEYPVDSGTGDVESAAQGEELVGAEEPVVEEDSTQEDLAGDDAIGVASVSDEFIEEEDTNTIEDAASGRDDSVLTIQSDDVEEGFEDSDATQVTFTEDNPYGLTAEELFEGYAQKRIDETLPEGVQDPLAIETQSAAKNLSGTNKAIYDYLKPLVAEVASGTRTNTIISVPFSVVASYYNGPWTAADLGVSAVYSNGLTSEAKSAAAAKLGIDCGKVFRALLLDCPYEMYWCDITSTTYPAASSSPFGYSYTLDRATRAYAIGFNANSSFNITFTVCKDYSSTGREFTTTMKSGVAKTISAALSTAQSIVTANKGKTPYAMLKAYKDKICSLVSYDMATYLSGDSVAYGNPWQLIHVFDGNTSTNVVCEGYAKAFKYLCDLSGLSDVECIIATGEMAGGTGAGGHMWNVVHMDDGKNYIVDVTNSDTNTVGYENYLFLAPAVSGSYSSGYKFKTSTSVLISYTYDSTSKNSHGSAALTIANSDYVAPKPRTSISGATVKFSGTYPYNGKAQLPDPVVTLAGKTLTIGKDYTVSYSPAQPINAGTVTVTVTGVDTYKDTAKGTYNITRKSIAAPTAHKNLKYNGKAQEGVSAGDGYTLSGTPKATNVGTYTATAKLTSNYAWSDGTTADKTISWSIGYATATVTADNKSKVAGEIDPDFTATVTGLIGSDKVTYSFTRPAGEVAGKTYAITPTGDDTQGNYSVRYVKGTLYVHATPSRDISAATVTVTNNNQEYSGRAITATLRVELDGQVLAEGTHYTVTGDSATDAGTHTLTIHGRDVASVEGGFMGTKTATFTIKRCASAQVPVAVTGLTYKGTEQTGVTAKSADHAVLSGTTSATDAGDYVATAVPDENHEWLGGGTQAKSIPWTIARKVVTVTPQAAWKTYGAADPSLYAKTTGLLGSDKIAYKVTREAGENAGTYQYTATATAAQGNYEVVCDNSKYVFTIDRKQIDPPTATTGLVYTGSSQTGVPAGTGYTIAGNVATDANTYKAVATLNSNYAWTGGGTSQKTYSWSIAKASITTATVALSSTSYAYDEETKQPTVSVKLGTKELELNTAYTVSGTTAASKVGSYSVTVKGIGNYKDSVTRTWVITKIDQTISVSATRYSKTFGNPAFNLNARLSNTELKLAYKSSNTKVATVSTAGLVTIKGAGTATITISQAGNANYNAATPKTVTVTVAKATNPLTASAKAATITKSYSPTKSIVTTTNIKKSNAKGAVTFSNVSTNTTAKKFTVDPSTGKVTVPMATKAGTYAVIVRATAAGDANYKSGYKNVSFKITLTKIANSLKVKAKSQTVSLATVKAKAVTVAPLTVTGAKGKVTYSLSGGSGKLSISSTTGKVTVKKGSTKGSCSATVKVTAAGDANYLPLTKSVTIRVSIK